MVFEYNGKKYSMSEEEIEAAYRYQQRQYRMADCEAHLENMEERISRAWGLTLEEAKKYEDEIVDYYEKVQDCNIDENSIWEEMAIPSILFEHRKKGDES